MSDPAPATAKTERPRRLMKPVVLIGLMGAGKTSVGARLAQALGVGFVDSDAEIEAAANRTIPEIFEHYGEAEFRSGERRVIARLLSEGPRIIATGGGAFMEPETRKLLAGRAITVWLKADLDLLVSRTVGRTHRPLLNRGNPREILADLIEKRYPTYANADLAVQSRAGQSHEQMAARIIAALEADGRAFAEEVD